VISELKYTVGWKAIKVYLYRVSHAEELTGSGFIIADISSHTSDIQGVIGKVSDAVKEISMTRLNKGRRIGAIKATRKMMETDSTAQDGVERDMGGGVAAQPPLV
jgi:hypothetical protein